MSEYDLDGDGYTDHAITAEFTDGSSATVVDVDGDGYADAVVYEPVDPGHDPGYDGGGEYDDPDQPIPTGVEDPSTSSQYFNDYTDTGVSSDGDVGYIALGDGTFYDFGMG
jgi:hypothetical protein